MGRVYKILYVDPLSPIGHINFNNIYISAISAIPNVKIDFVFQDNYINALTIPEGVIGHTFSYGVSKRKYNGFLNKISWRIHQMTVMFLCKKLMSENQYDYIFFSSFDEICILFSGIVSKKVLAVCHANAEHIPNFKISLIVHKLISKEAHLLTLNKALSEYMLSVGIKNTFVPHGFPDVCADKTNSRFIFVPIMANMADMVLMKELVSNKFSKVLEKFNVQFILKENAELPHNLHNIIYTNNTLSQNEYIRYFKKASLIILPYNKDTYVFRTSAMLIEAISYNKNVVVPRVKSFLSLYCDEDDGFYIYDNVDDIIRIVKTLFATNSVPIPKYDNIKKQNGKIKITESILKIFNENQ